MVSCLQLYGLDHVPINRGETGIDKADCPFLGRKTFFKKFIKLANVLLWICHFQCVEV
ncbi:hypothetical protein IYQ_07166 [Aeromonas salmonicida subsp. salmonicida 01-B526]|uniref:Uncharacterized protein n=1 Tax=Aeromonas salmonicida subsp. salmonicida 01-B526 TaxID=1076135 RepID=A0ABN0E1N8_AERSS|nr:hypothetical protein IYQ_07166 [Aeromonas salmonicida subsp. salmonicida 01-B526]